MALVGRLQRGQKFDEVAQLGTSETGRCLHSQSLGLGEHAGTKAVSLSGDIQRPGNYEVPFDAGGVEFKIIF